MSLKPLVFATVGACTVLAGWGVLLVASNRRFLRWRISSGRSDVKKNKKEDKDRNGNYKNEADFAVPPAKRAPNNKSFVRLLGFAGTNQRPKLYRGILRDQCVNDIYKELSRARFSIDLFVSEFTCPVLTSGLVERLDSWPGVQVRIIVNEESASHQTDGKGWRDTAWSKAIFRSRLLKNISSYNSHRIKAQRQFNLKISVLVQSLKSSNDELG